MSTHTPVPWKFRAIGTNRGVVEGPGEDCTIATMARWFAPYDSAEQVANGRFIETACNSHADLLKSLKRYVAKFGDCGTVYDAARAAIDKAT